MTAFIEALKVKALQSARVNVIYRSGIDSTLRHRFDCCLSIRNRKYTLPHYYDSPCIQIKPFASEIVSTVNRVKHHQGCVQSAAMSCNASQIQRGSLS